MKTIIAIFLIRFCAFFIHITSIATCFSWSLVVDWACKIATVLIALFNVFYIIWLNKNQSQDDSLNRESERKRDLFKAIVLVPNLRKMYKFFDALWNELIKLKLENFASKTSEIENEVKTQIEPEIQRLFSDFRSDFIIALNATVPDLGESLQNVSDNMRDTLLGNMSDDGINLWVPSYFNSRIKSVFENGKQEMINALFNYSGQ